jgi:predicted TIM-barrel fold metal-dependent hydrolase
MTEDYTLYDAHMHVASEDPRQALQILEACDIKKAIILNKGYGKNRPNTEHKMWERVGFEILERYPDRFVVFSSVDFSTIDEPDFASRAAAHFAETVKAGASGLKLWLGKPTNHWMALDDPRIGAVYEKAAELDVPVLIHIGDPPDYWKKEVTSDSFWYEILKQNPQWSFYGKEWIPSREVLFEEQRRMLESYPDTIFICPHMGGHAENLEYLGELLDEFPNLYVDTAAYEPILGQAPDRARPFLIKYQNRIMVGTDNGWVATSLEILARRTRAKRFFYESDIEQKDLDDIMPRKPGYTIRGLKLPPDVIRKLYYENVVRLVPALAKM